MIRRFFQVLPAGLDALLAGMFTTFLVTLPVFIGWLTQLVNGASWVGYWRFSAGSWLLANNVPYEFSRTAIGLIPEFASFGLSAFTVSLVPLALTLLIVQQAWSAGRRIAGLDLVWPSIVTGLVVYLAYVILISSTTHWEGSRPLVPWLFVGPVLTYGIPLVIGSLVSNNEIESRSIEARWLRQTIAVATSREPDVWAVLTDVWALGKRWLLALLLTASAGMSIALMINWFTVSNVFQVLHVDMWGAIGLFIAQLLYLPNVIIAFGTWLCGGTLTIGATTVSALSNSHGAIPAIPILSLIPSDKSPWHIVVLALPCLVLAIFATLFFRQVTANNTADASASRRLAVIIGAAVLTAFVAAIVGWIGSGIVGTHAVGPQPWSLGLAVFVQTIIAGLIGVGIERYLLAPAQSGRVG